MHRRKVLHLEYQLREILLFAAAGMADLLRGGCDACRLDCEARASVEPRRRAACDAIRHRLSAKESI